MTIGRRAVVAGGAVAAAAAAGWLSLRFGSAPESATPLGASATGRRGGGGMVFRDFGATGMRVSEVAFGAWGIGGNAYGGADRQESLRALARAEELGCNFVDTAAVYGDSEAVLGEFLSGRRSKWLISTKYSGQPEGMTATIETQLKTLRTDAIDFYQIHWAPDRSEHDLYEQLYALKKSGKARAVGVSLKSVNDIDYVLDHTSIDGFMVRLSLLDPEPLLSRLHRCRERRPALIVRSALKEGFLTGKYDRNATFPDENDQRHSWSRERIAETVDNVERFRFLEAEAGSMLLASASYPLSLQEVSTVVLGTEKATYAETNFGALPGARLSAGSLARIHAVQNEMGLRSTRELLMEKVRALAARF